VGSGKTETRRQAIRAIAELSVPASGKKGSKIGSQIANAEVSTSIIAPEFGLHQFILDSFGNAHTLTNDNASRFGNYTELQFSEKGKLEGLKSIEYYLERSRVSQTPSVGERNFHVFYYLVAGIKGEEKTHLKLGEMHDYRYLQCRVRRTGVDDKQRFEQLKQAFRTVGLSTRLVAQICQLLAAILHVGNLQFSSERTTEDGAIVTNMDVLATVAEFLGVPTELLAELFSFKSVLVDREVCTTFLDAEQAEQVRDELARTLYSLLFSWLNEHINQKLCKDTFASFIALLDLPGPQTKHLPSGDANSIDQFCFNFANEQVHNWVLKRIHDAPIAEADRDKLTVPRVPYFDNSECLKMLGTSRGSLVHIMDDQARKKKTDASFLEAIGRRHNGHQSFGMGDATSHRGASFTIQHFSGPVTYSAENFLEKNANETSADVLRLLRGTSITVSNVNSDTDGSNNPFIRSLFSSKAIATQAHPRNDDTIVAVQQPVRPMRAPSTRRKRGPRLAALPEQEEEGDDQVGGGNDEGSAGKELQCVAGQHWTALSTLLDTFEHAQAWFVFCLKPNDSQLPSQVDIRGVRAQIRSVGISEMAVSLQNFHEVRMSHQEACERYAEELAVRGIADGLPNPQKLVDLKRVLRLSDAQLNMGTDRVSSSGRSTVF
jgi:chitin synthase